MSLRLVDVSQRFGRRAVLEHVSLDVRPGDLYGFLGHNGAGKTTAMRIALGLQRPLAGRVIVDGFDAARFPREARARLGGLVEQCGFQPHWSGEKNLTELARAAGSSRAEARRRAGSWIERVGLAHARDQRVGTYSQGMRQRLGIAQALIGEPLVALLDEPTNGLDPEGIADVRELLRDEVRDGRRAVLVSSHQLHEIAGLCTRIGVLRQGRMLAQAPTDELLSGGARRFRLECGDPDRARNELVRLGLAPEPAGSAIAFDLGTLDPARVTRALVESGVELRSFAPAPWTLEEVYLRLSHGPATSPEPAAAREPAPIVVSAPSERRAPARPIPRAAATELRRVTGSLAVPLLLLAPAAAGILAMVQRAAQSRSDTQAVGSKALFSATEVNGFEAVGLALQAGLPVLAFLALAIASQSIAAEHARGTLRNLLLRPFTRAQLALGKLGALLALVLGGYALLVASALLAARVAFGFGDVSEALPNGSRYVLTHASELWPELHRALLSPVLPLAAYAALGFSCGTLVRGAAGALGLALGLGVALDVGRALARGLVATGALVSDHLPSPLSDTSFVRFYVDVSQGVSNASEPSRVTAALVPLAWAAAATAVAMLALDRRDVP